MADLRVEVGADAARALAVEEGDVDNAQMPTILVDPQPRTMDAMLDAATRARLDALGASSCTKAPGRMPDEVVEAHLADTVAIVGQTDLDAERIARAPALRAVVNVEGNFLRNVDYEACFARGIHVLVASPAFAPAVAEAALGMAIDLARGITRGRPRHARRHGGLRARGQPRLASCWPAATSASSGSATSGASSCACSRPSAVACAPTTRGCPSWPSAPRAPSPPASTSCCAPRGWSSSSPRPRPTTRRCSAGASSSSCRTAPRCWS